MSQQNIVFKDLRSEVYQYFDDRNISRKANTTMFAKFMLNGFVVVALYLALLFAELPTSLNLVILLFLLPLFLTYFMINSLHDMMHGSYSHKGWVKEYVSYLLDLMGPSSFIWKTKHNLSHHYHTNHAALDNDLNVSVLIRLSPHQKYHGFHAYQHLYISFIYCLQCFFWFFISDLRNVIQGVVAGKKIQGLTKKEILIFSVNKVLHLTLGIGIPAMIFGWSIAVQAYFACYFVTGFILAIIFQVAHIFEGSHFHNIEKFASTDEWATYQVMSSCVFSVRSPWTNFTLGGLNMQVVHHLFPEISHAHYPAIYPIIEKHCLKHQVPLKCFKNFYAALSSHYKMLSLLGQRTSFENKVHAL
jgi:linoleoyl-CoA desaturase